jgi:hypothetical protein
LRSEFLTISISETWQDHYKVIAYDFNQRKFIALFILPDMFVNADGSNAWDLFGITDAAVALGNGGFYFPEGTCKVVRYWNKNEIRNFFEQMKLPGVDFVNRTSPYGIVKVSKVDQIHLSEANEGKFRMDFSVRLTRINRMLNKDLRWISYWKQVVQESEESVPRKVEQWKQYMNASERSRYAVLYYYTPHNIRWICGLHCI